MITTGSGRARSLTVLCGLGLATAATALAGARSVSNGKGRWYRRLKKPPFNPPDWVFGPVWTTLYALSVWSAWRVWRRPASPARTRSLRLWFAQLLLNGAWSPLFFGMHRPRLAMADLVALQGTLGAYLRETRKVDPPAARLVWPYFAWTSFAGVINAEVVRRNP